MATTGSVPAGGRSRLSWILGLTSAAYFMVVLDALVVITALPRMQRDLHASLATLQWTVNAYGIAFAAGIITAAALGDRLGRRRVFVAGVALFTLASAACALAPGATVLIAARAVQGLGGAAVLPLSLTILTGAFPAERRGAIIGIYGGLAGLAVAIGPLVGGAVTEGLDWHWIFWINVPIGVAAGLLSLRLLPETYGPPARLDLPGVALISAGVTGLVWGLTRASQAGWGSAEIVTTLALGAALLGTFLAWEARAPEPMLPLRMLRIRAFAAGNATAFFMSGAVFAAAFFVAEYFQLALGYSPLATGVRLLPWFATPMFVAPAAGLLSDRIGRRPVIATGLVLQAAGLGWVALKASPGTGSLQLVLALAVAGVGISMALPTVPAAVLSAVAPAEMGKASGISNMMQRFGAVFAVAVASSVFTAYGHIGSPASITSGFRPAVAVSAALSLLGAATALAITARARKTAAAPDETPASAAIPARTGTAG
ncbi:MAG: DHA2 family efflux MFS transporter permease subunit [Streptosporangiaceae bacterium]|nr:DHA2 family efflux MFS transporter permease subunit [Streptosporangiaceae bacterium]